FQIGENCVEIPNRKTEFEDSVYFEGIFDARHGFGQWSRLGIMNELHNVLATAEKGEVQILAHWSILYEAESEFVLIPVRRCGDVRSRQRNQRAGDVLHDCRRLLWMSKRDGDKQQ